jgi:hypothetical protein
MPNSNNILTEANHLIHGARQKTYLHPWDDFGRTAKIWSAILRIPIKPEQVALCMIGVKLSRLVATPDHRDSLVDIAGYAGTYEMVCERRKELEDD